MSKICKKRGGPRVPGPSLDPGAWLGRASVGVIRVALLLSLDNFGRRFRSSGLCFGAAVAIKTFLKSYHKINGIAIDFLKWFSGGELQCN